MSIDPLKLRIPATLQLPHFYRQLDACHCVPNGSVSFKGFPGCLKPRGGVEPASWGPRGKVDPSDLHPTFLRPTMTWVDIFRP